jgi:hypothetical protein
MKKKTPRRKDVVLLKDLSPRQHVRGSSGKRVFGELVETAPSSEIATEKKAKRPLRLKAEKRKTRGM